MNWMYEKLLPHRGHKIVCVSYGDWDDPADVCIECETCNCVLVSAEDFDEGEDPIYYPPVGSCDYDEHENDLYFIGDSEEKENKNGQS